MQQFEIAFSGEILPGAQLEQVKASIARVFQADDILLARLFSGQRVVIKQSVDAAAAAKYQAAFQRAGAALEVRDLTALIIEEIIPGLPVENPADAAQQTSARPLIDPAKPAMLQVAPRDEYMAAFKDVEAPDFGIAPLGADLQTITAAKPAANFDFSAMSLAPVGSDMGQLPAAEAVVAPDTSHIKLVD